MNQKKKLIDKFIENPKGTHYDDLVLILEAFGFIKVEAKGSHKKWKHPLVEDLTIPVHRGDCIYPYKLIARQKIREIQKQQKDT